MFPLVFATELLSGKNKSDALRPPRRRPHRVEDEPRPRAEPCNDEVGCEVCQRVHAAPTFGDSSEL